MHNRLRWGILGTGGIARKFASQNRTVDQAEVVAVASRRQESAEAFASEQGGVPYAGYDRLLADESVDAVYISLPNALHCEWTIRALEAGKHVLCEKPLAVSAAEAEQMFAAADAANRLLIEAFMYRCHPAVQKFLEVAHSGAIGEIRLIRAHFTFNRPSNSADVRYHPELAGGALMDVGCYCLNFARAVADREPTAMHVLQHRHPTGVDDYSAGMLQFGDGPLCSFTCGMTVNADRTAYVGGSEGYLAIDTPWISAGTFQLVRGTQSEKLVVAGPADQYALEAACFADAVRGEKQPWITRADSLGNMRVLDALRDSQEGRLA